MPARCRPRCARNCEDLLVDVAGLCLTARNEDYVKAALAGWDDDGPCTAIGHARTHERGRRRLRQRHRRARRGFRRHLRGRPGACRRGHRAGGARGLRAAQSRRARRRCVGIAVGVETMCRLSLVAPKAVHKAGFHPTAVFGAMAAAAGVGAALGLEPAASSSMRSASPARWPAASSNISPRAPGPSACMPAGRRSRACARRCSARAGFFGPRTVFEGVHGLFHGFAHTTRGRLRRADRRFRRRAG